MPSWADHARGNGAILLGGLIASVNHGRPTRRWAPEGTSTNMLRMSLQKRKGNAASLELNW